MRKGGGGRKGSHLQLMTTSRAKTRRLEKEEWTLVSRSRSGGTTPALPLPEILPPSFSCSSFPREKWKGNSGRALPLPSSICASPTFFLSLIISFSLISPLLPTTIFLYLLLFAFSPTPLSPPLLMADTTKSAACGLNGNQTLTHSSLACRLLPCIVN